MLIKWNGVKTVRRIITPYEWSRQTNFIQDVDASMAAELLSSPYELFLVSCDDPMIALLGLEPDQVSALALEGIGNIWILSELKGDDVKRIGHVLWPNEKSVVKRTRSLIKAAKKAIEGGTLDNPTDNTISIGNGLDVDRDSTGRNPCGCGD